MVFELVNFKTKTGKFYSEKSLNSQPECCAFKAFNKFNFYIKSFYFMDIKV